jgi:sec-independent protein translocase protein TatA
MNTMFGLLNLGGGEIILILAMVLILFGAKKLPELAKGLGQGIKEFKKAAQTASEDMREAMLEGHPTSPKPLARATFATTQPESAGFRPPISPAD